MTDKELIKKEIERLEAYPQSRGFIKHMIAFIDSLQDEQVSEDLEKEISKWRNHYISVLENNFRIDLIDIEVTAKHFAHWQHGKDFDDLLQSEMKFPKEYYEKGKADMREEMMKNAILETKVITDCDGDGIETPYKEWLTLENTEIPSLPDSLGLKDGDKVKIIIVKEEQQ